MRQLIKISFITLAAGALFWAPLQAMPVATSSEGVNVDISGFAGSMTGQWTPANEDAPATMVSIIEARLNVTAGTDSMSVQMARWIREDNGMDRYTFSEQPYQFAQLTWKPMDALRIDAGSMVYLPWTDRSIQWEWFAGVGPVHPSGIYLGYIENVPGIDVSYDVGGGIEVGVGIMTTGVISGTSNSVDGSGTESVGQTIIPHLIYKAGPLGVLFSYYSESSSTTGDAWATQTDTSDTMMALDVKFQFDDAGSFVKLDYISATGDHYDDACGAVDCADNTVLGLAATFKLGADAVYAEYESDTASGGVDGVDKTYMRVGYSMAVAASSDIRIEYGAADNGADTNNASNIIQFVLFQGF